MAASRKPKSAAKGKQIKLIEKPEPKEDRLEDIKEHVEEIRDEIEDSGKDVEEIKEDVEDGGVGATATGNGVGQELPILLGEPNVPTVILKLGGVCGVHGDNNVDIGFDRGAVGQGHFYPILPKIIVPSCNRRGRFECEQQDRQKDQGSTQHKKGDQPHMLTQLFELGKEGFTAHSG